MVIAHLENGPWILGLSERNIEKLKEGQPILKSLAQHGGPDVDLLIMYGKTEADIATELKKHYKFPDGPPFKKRLNG